MSSSALTTATNGVASIKSADGFILTEPFLEVCRLVLPVVGEKWTKDVIVTSTVPHHPMHGTGISLSVYFAWHYHFTLFFFCMAFPHGHPDQLGTAFMLVRTDINGNIQRLSSKAAQDPTHFHRLFALVQDDIVRGTQGDSTSVTKGLLWLKR